MTVLMHPPVHIPDPNQTVAMLVGAMPPAVRVQDFTWRRALFGRYDVFHLHWPERIARGPVGYRRVLKALLVPVLAARLRVTGTPVIWTVHNESPHESRHLLDRLLATVVMGMATTRVYMYRSGVPAVVPTDHRVIPRGDYRPVYGDRIASARPAGRPVRQLLLFGLLRPYKGIEDLVDAFADAELSGAELVIAGDPKGPHYGAELGTKVAGLPSVRLRAASLTDAELADEIEAADVVVLPYRRMYNSGAALLALDFGRPIIVPGSATMLELRAEVGPEWVHVYEGGLTAAVLEDLVARIAAEERPARPSFTHRDWAEVAARYAELYESVRRR